MPNCIRSSMWMTSRRAPWSVIPGPAFIVPSRGLFAGLDIALANDPAPARMIGFQDRAQLRSGGRRRDGPRGQKLAPDLRVAQRGVERSVEPCDDSRGGARGRK